MTLLISCAPVDLNAPMSTYDTGADVNQWSTILAGEFIHGQFNETTLIDYDYQIMTYLVTTAQYANFLNEAITNPESQIVDDGKDIVGFYPGDEYHGIKHEEKIEAGDRILIPHTDPSTKIKFDRSTASGYFPFTVKEGYENHPMTNVTWFGALAYCQYYGWRLPTEMEWEKAARGPADGENPDRPFPWGDEILRENANYYSSRDPFENMSSFGSRTSPVGFYNGQNYNGYQTVNSVSPYGLYDMAGNVWQWTGDVYEGMHYRFMRGGSKDTYDMDLRVWVRNNATPMYYSPGVGFRCVR